MRRLSFAMLLLNLFGLSARDVMADGPAEVLPESATHYQDHIRPQLARLCGDCHAPEDQKNAVRFLKAMSLDDLDADRGLWHSVAEQLHNRTMPPADNPQPSEDERLELITWIENTLRSTACRRGEFAGPVTPRRLNRYEYERTIHDLMGVDYRASETFPTDGSGGEGFNNNGETLFLPPLLMERYLAAATEILDQAIVSTPLAESFGPDALTIAASARSPDIAKSNSSGESVPGQLAPGQQAAALITIYKTSDYDAVIRTRSSSDQPSRWLLQIDGIDAERWTATGSDPTLEFTHRTVIHLTRGEHVLSVKNGGSIGALLERIEVRSPDKPPSEAQRARHRQLLLRNPGPPPADPRAAAREVLTHFAKRAFRRPVATDEIDRILALYDRGVTRGDPDEEALKLALKGVLVSPSFLFRIESEPQSVEREPLSDHELAVRLSYFLWSSQPDEELLQLADEGRLHQPDVLRMQVDRLLADPRARAFADQFIGQWLGTHEVGARVAPSTDTFKGEFTTALLLDLHDEPIYFFQQLIARNASVLEILDCDYAIVNKRLAEHYELNGEKRRTKLPENPWTRDPKRGSGGPFEMVSLTDDRRGGVLGMGAVHMLTSYPDRTSPVLRGGWVLETLLGIRVPPPPPDVPQLKRNKKSTQSLREQLAQHRASPTCAACHNLMDPLGFALENFDVLGRWREQDGKSDIDASATLPSGEAFSGPDGLRHVLLQRKSAFVQQMTRKLLGYALGRSLEDADDCTVQRISAIVEQQDNAVCTMIHEVVQSAPFRYRQRASNME
ncbi:MAG: DUF1592 domain-containing protein [Planctomycetaceae bacterium]